MIGCQPVEMWWWQGWEVRQGPEDSGRVCERWHEIAWFVTWMGSVVQSWCVEGLSVIRTNRLSDDGDDDDVHNDDDEFVSSDAKFLQFQLNSSIYSVPNCSRKGTRFGNWAVLYGTVVWPWGPSINMSRYFWWFLTPLSQTVTNLGPPKTMSHFWTKSKKEAHIGETAFE